MAHELVLRFANQAGLAAEHALNLRLGRAFLRGETGFPLFSRTHLVIEHPASGERFAIAVEVIMVMTDGSMRGCALQFLDRSEETFTALSNFVNQTDDLEPDSESKSESEPAHEGGLDRNLSRERQLRLRNLPPNEQLRLARAGTLDERVLLERIYGSAVWEPLLRNAKITVPEVARMARKGTLPRPLLDLIVENESWVRQSVVRRALLSNPRLSSEAATKVLRTLPRRDLKLVPQQKAYPATVRAAAQRLMRE